MSYCVNCGVKLDDSLKKCPLCNTPVINPNELKTIGESVTPYPKEKGVVESAKRKDFAILIFTVLASTSFSCFLLNLLVFTGPPWSLFIIGACILLFVLLLPFIIHIRIPGNLCVLFDGIATAFYLYLISYNTTNKEWFIGLALPIVILITVLTEVFIFFYHLFPVSILTSALYFFADIAIFCVGLELLIDFYLGLPLMIGWSAIVLTICTVISVALLTIIASSHLREIVRKRLHF